MNSSTTHIYPMGNRRKDILKGKNTYYVQENVIASIKKGKVELGFVIP